mmetsp:Transcript_14351/g.31136  ORF Transcript_14351/g.31136 Transcript_14351/m.31136 type:complete len:348 (-) Transcript_14351:2028-3071(-)
MVGHVKVVRSSRVLGRECINLLRPGRDIVPLTLGADIIFGVSSLEALSDLLVRVSIFLGFKHELIGHFIETGLLHLVPGLDNSLETTEEPMVDLGDIMDVFDSHGLVVKGLGDSKDALVGRNTELLLKLLLGELHGRLETGNCGVNHTKGLLDRLLLSTADGHDFTNTLHGRSDLCTDSLELGHVPTRNLGDDVIETGLKSGLSLLGYGVDNLGHGNTKAKLGCYKSKGISGGLGGKGGGTGKTRVDFNNSILERFRMESILDVALADNSKMTDDTDGGITKHVIFFIGKGLGRCHDDTVTCVDTKRIKVLHVAYGDAVVVSITDDLVLDLLPSLHTLLNQNLGTGR